MAKRSFFGPRGLFGSREAGHAPGSRNAVAVLGLGRFGQSVALELMAEGSEVLGVDTRGEVVQRLDGRLTYVVAADASDPEVLDQLSVPEFDRVVLGITSSIAPSILTASQLVRFGTAQVWAAAASEQHGLILDQLGVHHVVYPEEDMGTRVAHLVRGSLLDYIPVEGGFAVAETMPHPAITGIPLDPARIQRDHGVAVIARRADGHSRWAFAGAGTVLSAGDRILVAGPPARTDAFSQLT